MISKLSKGFKKKLRTKEEIDKAYTFHAVQYAHKARIISQMEGEMYEHLEEMKKANEEAMSLPPEPPKTPAVAQKESGAA